jgi:hypothetical protein
MNRNGLYSLRKICSRRVWDTPYRVLSGGQDFLQQISENLSILDAVASKIPRRVLLTEWQQIEVGMAPNYGTLGWNLNLVQYFQLLSTVFRFINESLGPEGG